MTLSEHFRKNLILAYPVVIGQLGHIMVSVADTIMVGRVGVIPLAAATFAGTFYHILMLFGIGVSYAITPLVASTDSSDRPRHSQYLHSALTINLALGVIMTIFLLVISQFLMYFGQEAEVARAAEPYLIVVGLSLVPLMTFQTHRQYAEGLSDTFNPMVVSVISNILNVVLNYLLIYGALGFPEMGLMGAAYATLISRVIMSALMWAILKKNLPVVKGSFSWEHIRTMIRIGIPSGMQYVFEVGAFAVATIMVGWISAEALAAHQIALNISAITYMAATGIASAATIRIGNQLGLKDLQNLKTAGYSSFATVTIFMMITACIFVIFRDFLPTLYVTDTYVQGMAAGLLIIAAGFQVSDGLQAVGLGILRGLRDVKIPTLVTFVAYWLISIPSGYVMCFELGLGVKGIWFGLLGGLSIAGALHIVRFQRLTGKLHFK